MTRSFIKLSQFLNTIDHIKKEETDYFIHMKRALSISLRLLGASLALSIHAFFPNKFKYTGSSIIIEEYTKLQHKKETV